MNYYLLYENIIEKARLRIINDVYTEDHHILPKCLGGRKTKSNMIRLTYREHFLAHWLLCKIHPENLKLKYAFTFMLGDATTHTRKVTSKEYSIVKRHIKDTIFENLFQKGQEPWNKGKIGSQVAWNKGVPSGPMDDKEKQRRSEILKEYWKDKEHHRKGKSPWCAGTKGTGVVKAWNKGKEMPKTECIFCHKMVDALNMKKWHGEKCKERSDEMAI